MNIIQNFINGLPKIPYDNGVGAFLGTIAHSTGNYGNPNDPDTVDSERAWENQDWKNAFVHFFVDWNHILHVADINYIAYGACHTGNHAGYVQIELCQTEDHDKFLASYDKYTWLHAKILFDAKKPIIDGETLRSHKNISDTYKESDHQDPIEYLASHGKTWDDVVSDVKKYYKFMEVLKMLKFNDADKISGYAQDSVKSITDKGIMKGDTDGNFKPLEPITRQDIAVIIANLLKYLGK